MGKPTSSCHNCGARLVQGAEICDLCGTLVSSENVVAPDWIDSERSTVPAYRTIPDPPAVKKAPPPSSQESQSAKDDPSDRKRPKHKSEKRKGPKPSPEIPDSAAEPTKIAAVAPAVLPNESQVDSPKPLTTAESAVTPDAPVDVLPEEDFFQGDPASTESVEATESPLTEVDLQKEDGSFEIADVLPEEDFFQSDIGSADVAAPPGEAVDGLTEVDLEKQAGTFESADVVPVEDFFGGGAESESESETAAEDDLEGEAPTEVDLQKSAGTFEGAEVLPSESFFDEPEDQDDPAQADETLTNAVEAAEGIVTDKQRTVEPGHAETASEIADALADDSPVSSDTVTEDTQFDIDHQLEHGDREVISTEPPATPEPTSPPSKKRQDPKAQRREPDKPGVHDRQRGADRKATNASSRGSVQREPVSGSRPGQSTGSKRQGRPAVEPSENFFEKTSHSDSGKRNALLVSAGGILLVAGLFLINSLSGGSGVPDEVPRRQMTDVTPIAPPPLSDEQEEVAQALKAEIVPLSGRRRIAKQRELISVYALERRFDLAAVVQQEIAQAENSEVEWVRTGNYFYDWMETQSGATKTEYAKHAIAAYQRALDINPDNLDVRTNMALAYLYDPDNPMQAIRNTNIVLEKNPEHVLANFNKGVMLMQINRLSQAKEQFNRVKTLVGDPNSPIYQRAEMAVQTIERHSSG